MNAIWLLVLVVLLVGTVGGMVNFIIIKRLIESVPNVWNGAFKIILDDGQVIQASFGNGYNRNFDMPKDRLIKELIIEQVPKGFVPMMIVTGSGKFEVRLVTDLFDFPKDERLVNLRFEIINPETPPVFFRFAVASNQRILGLRQRSDRGVFISPFDFVIYYSRSES